GPDDVVFRLPADPSPRAQASNPVMIRPRLFVVFLAIALTMAALVPRGVDAQDDSTRSIVPDSFLTSRPAAAGRPSTAKPVYRPVTPAGTASPGGPSVDLGVTLWRLRPSRAQDRTRLLTHEGVQTSEWTPERVRLDTRLRS